MNRMAFDELLYKLAIEEDLVGADVHGRLRSQYRDDATVREFMKPVQQGQQMLDITHRVDQMRSAYATATPIEKAAIGLAAREGGLRGRLADAILHLDLTAPGDVRDALSAAQAVAGNNHPGALTDAVSFLRDAGFDGLQLEKLEADRAALYPADPDDLEVPNVAADQG